MLEHIVDLFEKENVKHSDYLNKSKQELVEYIEELEERLALYEDKFTVDYSEHHANDIKIIDEEYEREKRFHNQLMEELEARIVRCGLTILQRGDNMFTVLGVNNKKVKIKLSLYRRKYKGFYNYREYLSSMDSGRKTLRHTTQDGYYKEEFNKLLFYLENEGYVKLGPA